MKPVYVSVDVETLRAALRELVGIVRVHIAPAGETNIDRDAVRECDALFARLRPPHAHVFCAYEDCDATVVLDGELCANHRESAAAMQDDGRGRCYRMLAPVLWCDLLPNHDGECRPPDMPGKQPPVAESPTTNDALWYAERAQEIAVRMVRIVKTDSDPMESDGCVEIRSDHGVAYLNGKAASAHGVIRSAIVAACHEYAAPVITERDSAVQAFADVKREWDALCARLSVVQDVYEAAQVLDAALCGYERQDRTPDDTRRFVQSWGRLRDLLKHSAPQAKVERLKGVRNG